jgi:hypothetical protein
MLEQPDVWFEEMGRIGLADFFARKAGACDNTVPALPAQILGKVGETFGVMLDEIVRADFSSRALILLQHLFHDPLKQRHIPVDAHGQEEAG